MKRRVTVANPIMQSRRVRRGMVVASKKVEMSVGVLIEDMVYVNRLDTEIDKNDDGKEIIRVRPGALLVRNIELTQRYGHLNPAIESEQAFLVYDNLHALIRAFDHMEIRYGRYELPDLDMKIATLRDMWVFLQDDRQEEFLAGYYLELAKQQKISLALVRDVFKAVARLELTELIDELESPVPVAAQHHLREIVERYNKRKQTANKRQGEAQRLHRALVRYRADIMKQLSLLDDTMNDIIKDPLLYGKDADPQAQIKVSRILESQSACWEQLPLPRPYIFAARHIAKDLSEAAKLLKEDAKLKDDNFWSKKLHGPLGRVKRSIFMVQTRDRLEGMLATVSRAMVLKQELKSKALWQAFHKFVLEAHKDLSHPDLEEGFENPVTGDVLKALALVIQECAEDAPNLKKVKKHLKAAVKPI